MGRLHGVSVGYSRAGSRLTYTTAMIMVMVVVLGLMGFSHVLPVPDVWQSSSLLRLMRRVGMTFRTSTAKSRVKTRDMILGVPALAAPCSMLARVSRMVEKRISGELYAEATGDSHEYFDNPIPIFR